MPVKKVKQEQGFTLVETMVAIFILMLALTGPIYIATLALRTAAGSRDGISARYLAEEVVEVIRNRRDNRTLNKTVYSQTEWAQKGADTLTGGVSCFNPKGSNTSKCEMQRDFTVGTYSFVACGATCSQLRFTPNGTISYYGTNDTSAPFSKFIREFYIEVAPQDTSATNNPQKELRIVVNIKWNDHGTDKIYTLTEYLHNLQYNSYAE
ncbi:MAG: hypothetical protein RJB39_805 [Candidatus Parcubacteria bacterium]